MAGAPPRPPFVLFVGVTGHRLNRLDAQALGLVTQRLPEVLSLVQQVADDLHARNASWFAGDAAEVRLATGLAEGADQLATQAALDAGMKVAATLPFSRDDYAEDFPVGPAREAYRNLLEQASTILELPGERAQEETAYTLASAAILSVADILIAVWNGEGSAGRGGTSDTVATALSQGRPVIHVPIRPDQPVRMLWSGSGPESGSWHAALEPPTLGYDRETLTTVLAPRLLPPDDPAERQALSAYLDETEELVLRRNAYPLLLWVLGADRFSKAKAKRPPYRSSTREYWNEFDSWTAGWIAPDRWELLEAAYSWSDNLATRFAQYFRSGHVINFSFSAIAIALALTGLLVGTLTKMGLVAVELLLIGAIVVNTRIGHRFAWQQRWLDYRQLAERLRPMRSLKLLGVAQPPNVSAASRTGKARWIDWYATAVWRHLGVPSGTIDAARMASLIALLTDHEIGPEMQYHKKNAHKMMHVHHRLHQFGSACFLATVILCFGFLLAASVLELTKSNAIIFSMLTAALPAFGSAAYGLRVQGDFAGSAARSAETALALQALSRDLSPTPKLTRTAAIANASAAVMLVDLAEWRLTYEQRRLEIPG